MASPEDLRRQAARLEEKQRERERREREKDAERRREERRREELAAQAVRPLSDDDLEAVAERPEGSWSGGGRLAINAHRALWNVPEGEQITVGHVQDAAQEEIERRDRIQQQCAEAAADGGSLSVTIAGRAVPIWQLALAVVLLLVALGDGDE